MLGMVIRARLQRSLQGLAPVSGAPGLQEGAAPESSDSVEELTRSHASAMASLEAQKRKLEAALGPGGAEAQELSARLRSAAAALTAVAAEAEAGLNALAAADLGQLLEYAYGPDTSPAVHVAGSPASSLAGVAGICGDVGAGGVLRDNLVEAAQSCRSASPPGNGTEAGDEVPPAGLAAAGSIAEQTADAGLPCK